MCHIPSQMRDKVRVYGSDVLLVSLCAFHDRCDMLVYYSWVQIKQLNKNGKIPIFYFVYFLTLLWRIFDCLIRFIAFVTLHCLYL